MKARQRNDRVLVFSHIPKTAGTTVRNILRTTFGVRHVDVFCRTKQQPHVYSARDLRKDMALYPWARSIAGHGPVAHLGYGEFDDRLVWYTFLRDPVRRFLSQYQFYCEVVGRDRPLDEWARSRPFKNYQVRWLAGVQDLSAAKEIVESRFAAVGLVEKFDDSLLILRQRLDVPSLNLDYFKARNRARSSSFRQSLEELKEKHSDLISEFNELDIELYQYVHDRIWHRQVEAYGGQNALDQDVRYMVRNRRERRTPVEEVLHVSNLVYRNIVYKPYARLDKGSQLST